MLGENLLTILVGRAVRRPFPCKHRGATVDTQRSLTVGCIKLDAPGSQLIQVPRIYSLIPAETTYVWTVLVCHNQ